LNIAGCVPIPLMTPRSLPSSPRQLGRLACLTLTLVGFAGCGGSAPSNTAQVAQTNTRPQAAADAVSPWTVTPEELPSPATGSSTTPQLTVEGERTILSWLELADSGTTLKFAERTSSGWSEPRAVASGDNFVVNAADVPSVRALSDGTLAAHWLLEDGPDPEAYKLPLSLSKDGGRTWSRPMNPNHDRTKTQHGFASLFQAPGAGLGVVWLDGRATNPDGPEGANGSMSLYGAVYDRDAKQISETAIDARVCDCCQLSAVATSEGVIVAYRDRTADEIRDIYVTRLVDGHWSPPTPVHADGWKIDGCPVNGPAVSARGRDVAVAWFTAKTGEGQAFAAFSQDGGRTFGQAIRVDDAVSRGQVDIELLADGSAAVTWVEFSNERSQFKVRRIEQSGARSPAVAIADISGSQYPRLAQSRGELLFAWTAVPPRVRTARASLGAPSPKDTPSASR